MAKKDRMPKADYFRMRYADAVEKGLESKAQYYRGRLEQMGEPISQLSKGGLTRHDFGNGLVIWSY